MGGWLVGGSACLGSGYFRVNCEISILITTIESDQTRFCCKACTSIGKPGPIPVYRRKMTRAEKNGSFLYVEDVPRHQKKIDQWSLKTNRFPGHFSIIHFFNHFKFVSGRGREINFIKKLKSNLR